MKKKPEHFQSFLVEKTAIKENHLGLERNFLNDENLSSHIPDTNSKYHSQLCFKVKKKARMPSAIALHLCCPGGLGQSNKMEGRRKKGHISERKGSSFSL